MFKKEWFRTFSIFKENIEVKKANINIELNQLSGDYIIQGLDECVEMVKEEGFQINTYNNNHYALGIFGSPIDYQIIAQKI